VLITINIQYILSKQPGRIQPGSLLDFQEFIIKSIEYILALFLDVITERLKPGQKMSGFNDSNVQQIADQIEFYLKNHPNAADTIEGITKWWLPEHGLEVSGLIVQQALNYLGSKSVVKCNATLCGNKVYSGNKAKAEYQSK
jgi:hypothetical protein